MSKPFQMILLKFRKKLRHLSPLLLLELLILNLLVAKMRPPEFTKEHEMTVHKGEDPAHDVPLVETREDLPEDQDPSPR
jgi:hypothetical protein